MVLAVSHRNLQSLQLLSWQADNILYCSLLFQTV
jgi:hypothetical protein